jgi:hypothetical protein
VASDETASAVREANNVPPVTDRHEAQNMTTYTIQTKNRGRVVSTRRVAADSCEDAARTLDARRLASAAENEDFVVIVAGGGKRLVCFPCHCQECGKPAVGYSLCSCMVTASRQEVTD